MLLTLVDHLPEPAIAPRTLLRERRHPCGLYIRKVKGFKYQLRWWLQTYGSVNCGLYDEESAQLVRTRLVKETVHYPPTPLGMWKALSVVLAALRLQSPERDWPEVLPTWVRRHSRGGFVARVKLGGTMIQTPGRYQTPDAAHRSLARVLAERRNFSAAPRPRYFTLLDPVGRRRRAQ